MFTSASRHVEGASRVAHVVLAAVAIWAVGLAALTAVTVLHQRADAHRRGQIVVSELRRQQGELPGIVFQSGLGNDVGITEARRRFIGARKTFVATERMFEQYVAADTRAAVGAHVQVYLRELDRVFASVAAGKLARAARQLGQTERPGGSALLLREELVAVSAESGRAAVSARRLGVVGSALIFALSLLAFSAALIRARLSARRLRTVATQNGALAVQNRASEERYRDLFDNATEPIAIVDLDLNLTDVNGAFARALGCNRETLIGSPLASYQTPEAQRLAEFHRNSKLAGVEDSSTYEQEFIDQDGQLVVFEVSTRLIEDNGRPIGFQGMCRDITYRKQAEALLSRQLEANHHQAYHDALTGLPNRASFIESLDREIAVRAEQVGPPSGFAVMMIDLDHFKDVNDSLGHRSGDGLLREVGRRLESQLRGHGIVARLGGDEFGLLLADVSETAACYAAERITRALEMPIPVDGLPLSIEASIGIVLHPDHGLDAEHLLKHADVAMYEAKRNSLSFAVYGEDSHKPDVENLTLLGELRSALARQELILHYQPKLDLGTGTVRRVEALIRWQHPKRGLLSPRMFMPLAERTGLIRELTQHVLEMAARQCRDWQRNGLRTAIAVNISGRNLAEPDLAENVVRLLQRWELEPDQLILEVTETAIAADPLRGEEALRKLSALGVGLALDDFGAGYTAVSHLARLPFDHVKIDRSLIKHITTDSRELVVVESLIGLAHSLSLEVVAEGVEEQDTLDTLVRLDCDLAQGYHVCRPLPPDEVLAYASAVNSTRRVGSSAHSRRRLARLALSVATA